MDLPENKDRTSPSSEVRELILRLANPAGDAFGSGELRGLGIKVRAAAIRSLLRKPGPQARPRRDGPSWSEFLRAQAEGAMACDFFSVETALRRTLYVLFFIEVGTRRMHITKTTATPDPAFVTQQARNLFVEATDRVLPSGLLIRDRDAKFTAPSMPSLRPKVPGSSSLDPGPEGQRLRRALG